MKLTGTDFFKDKDTIVREINTNDKGNLNVIGRIFGTDPKLTSDGLIFKTKTNWAGISFSQAPASLTFFASQDDLNAQRNPLSAPVAGGVFQADFSNVKNGTVYVAYTVASPKYDEATFTAQAVASPKGDMKAAEKAAEQRVNDYYAKIPQPSAQQLNILDKGTDFKDQLRTYYQGWTMMHESNMDPEYGSGFDYPTYANSKADLWNGGAKQTPYAAAWESFYIMQYDSFIDPDTAWQSYIGEMTQVSDDGSLAGEGLPANRARVGIILYNNSRTKQQGVDGLAKSWQKTELNLKWALNNPYWVFKGSTGAQQPDTDFLASAIIDVPYMEQIYDILQANGVIKDAAQRKADLEALRDKQLKNYQNWFFYGPDGRPIQKIINVDGKLSDPDPDIVNQLMVTKALHMPGLTADEYGKILNYFKSLFDPDQDFGHLGTDKYEEWAYTVYGLLEHGEKDLALQLIQTTLRDAPKVNTLSEEFHSGTDGERNDGNPYSAGVWVSAFDAAQVVDASWMINGLRYDNGQLRVYNLTKDGAITGIRSGNDVYSYTLKDGVVTDYKNGKLFKIEKIGPKDSDYVDLKTAPAVDKSSLSAAIDEAKKVDPAKYSAASVNALDDAVAAGQKVLDATDSTQSDVDTATGAIQTTLKGLAQVQVKAESGDAVSVDPADFYDNTGITSKGESAPAVSVNATDYYDNSGTTKKNESAPATAVTETKYYDNTGITGKSKSAPAVSVDAVNYYDNSGITKKTESAPATAVTEAKYYDNTGITGKSKSAPAVSVDAANYYDNSGITKKTESAPATAVTEAKYYDNTGIASKGESAPAVSVDAANYYDNSGITKKTESAPATAVTETKYYDNSGATKKAAAAPATSADKKTAGQLPKTGERESSGVGILGGLMSLLAVFGLAGIRRKKD